MCKRDQCNGLPPNSDDEPRVRESKMAFEGSKSMMIFIDDRFLDRI